MICNECETVAHCTSHGCIPKQPAPVAEPRKQEPVAKVIDWGIEGPRLKGLTEDWPRVGTLLYACPKQRTWVGLTDEERTSFVKGGTQFRIVKAIEAKLKEKNT